MSIFFTSDFHFCHDRDFIYKPRGFNTVNEMNQTILSNFQNILTWDDDLYILGDIMLNNDSLGLSYLEHIPGRKYIIRGNHDTDNRLKLYNQCYNIIKITNSCFFNYDNYRFYLSHFPCLCSNKDNDKPLKKQLINLCGHTHTSNKFNDMDKGIIYRVEVDAHNCKPVWIGSIIEDLKNYLK